MRDNYHKFHIPVMGTGHSADTAIRVAHFGISSVISLVDDFLLEKIRKYYSGKFGLTYSEIPRKEEDGRAKRITAYLDTVREIVQIKMENVKQQPFFEVNDKEKYFEMLPDASLMRKEYKKLLTMKRGPERDALAKDLTNKMKPGSIDANIMVSLDRISINNNGKPLSDEFSDAKAALRGYAKSSLESSIVFSAGINQKLFSYITRFRDFYRDKTGQIKKKIVLKVSDFRSARIQGRFLAKKGLEVHEFRIESGLNCGGHAFPTDGYLLPVLLREFKENLEILAKEFQPLVKEYYRKKGWEYPESNLNSHHLITVQGGIGTHGEVLRLKEEFNIDITGWGGSFLLVTEATCVDETTRELLRQASEDDIYMSNASPLNYPFNNVRNTGSEKWIRKMVEEGKPGSACPNGFLVSNTEFTDRPVCLASRQYQKMKLEEIDNMEISAGEKETLRAEVVQKTCICYQLGNGALISLGIVNEERAPQCICPDYNVAWFRRISTLKEMIDHIYGRGVSLVPPERPHFFVTEIVMYVDYFEKMVAKCVYIPKEIKTLREFKNNLVDGMDFCLNIAKKHPFEGENLSSIPPCVERQRARLESIYSDFENNVRTSGV